MEASPHNGLGNSPAHCTGNCDSSLHNGLGALSANKNADDEEGKSSVANSGDTNEPITSA